MTISIESLEGRLIAQRKLLSMILATMPASADIWRQIDQRALFQDSEEDPGVLPDRAFAIEAALADELRLIAEEARSFQAGRKDI